MVAIRRVPIVGTKAATTAGPTVMITGAERRRPDWWLCLWWVVIGIAAADLAAIPTALMFGSVVSAEFMPLAGIVGIVVGLIAAGLQAWLLGRRGVSAVLWLGAAVALVVVDLVAFSLLGIWYDFVMDELGGYGYSPERSWVALVGPVLQGLPRIILGSLVGGMVLAWRGPKSRLVWWVLASIIGYAAASLVGQLAQLYVQVLLYIYSSDLLYIAGAAGYLCASVAGGAVSSSVQGVTLAFLFMRGGPQVRYELGDSGEARMVGAPQP